MKRTRGRDVPRIGRLEALEACPCYFDFSGLFAWASATPAPKAPIIPAQPTGLGIGTVGATVADIAREIGPSEDAVQKRIEHGLDKIRCREVRLRRSYCVVSIVARIEMCRHARRNLQKLLSKTEPRCGFAD